MMDTAFEVNAFTGLAIAAVVLLLVVTGGVVYLTAAEWRDRRRRKRDQDAIATPSSRKSFRKK